MSKKAFLIGLNYFNSPHSLNGCHNDVLRAQLELGKRGFVFHCVLLDSSIATSIKIDRKLILETMNKFFSQAVGGDTLVVLFSGHGGQCDGKDTLEQDGKNECIFDANLDPIIDNDIKASIVDNIKVAGVKIYFHFDCCHSGTAIDLPYNYTILENRTCKPPSFFKSSMWDTFEEERAFWTKIIIKSSPVKIVQEYKPEIPMLPDVFLLSGCKDIQTSSDSWFEIAKGVRLLNSTTKPEGAMSHYFWNILNTSPKITFYELLRRLNLELKKNDYDQRPQLSSSWNTWDLTTLQFWL